MIYITYYKSPIENILLAAKNEKLIGAWFENQNNNLLNFKDEIKETEKNEILIKTKKWLDKYFNGEKPSILDLEIEPIGGEFRQRVWNILCEIPYGKTITYGDIAKRIAKETNKKMSAQAVGGAIGHNPIAIIIPCHRVIGASGNLTGYAGGIERKAFLLKHENNELCINNN